MTVTDLLIALKAIIEECTRDIVLPCRPEKPGAEVTYRPARVFLMDLPKKTDDVNLIPYIIIQVLTGQDEQKDSEKPFSQVGVRFAVGVYCEDMGEGKLNVLNIIERIRHRLLKREIIGGNFLLMDKIDWAIDPQVEGSYFFGEMLASFELPPFWPETPDYMGAAYRNTKWFDRTEELECLRPEISE